MRRTSRRAARADSAAPSRPRAPERACETACRGFFSYVKQVNTEKGKYQSCAWTKDGRTFKIQYNSHLNGFKVTFDASCVDGLLPDLVGFQTNYAFKDIHATFKAIAQEMKVDQSGAVKWFIMNATDAIVFTKASIFAVFQWDPTIPGFYLFSIYPVPE